ncbi:MAG: peptidyl-prolyl cis-trans isomerase [Candidatus Binatia bacterium]|nr:peptidyl-prolyl cis-trans isomerase [Candidatus Binatia bacterium]
MYRKARLLLLLLVVAVGYGFKLSFGQTLPAPAPTPGVLATVNGVPITEEDVRYASAGKGTHETGGRAVNKNDVLDEIIQQELIYQRAVKLGLEAEPTYQRDLGKLEAQVNAFKRKRLSQVYFERETARRAEVSDAEAREYYAKNTARLRTEVKVWQILKRNKDQIDQALNDLVRGKRFEDVAGKGLPNLPAAVGKPWDLGYLRWEQLPEPWRDVAYALKPGERSDIIRGPNDRFWIIKLIDRRENPAVSFEESKPSIMKMLRAEKMQRLREDISRDVREKARITYVK